MRAARADDLDAIKAMLAGNDLPTSDISADLLNDFGFAEDADGSVVGSVGLEKYGPNALLRSLAVAQPARNAGPGGRPLQRTTVQVGQCSSRWSVSPDYRPTARITVCGGPPGCSARRSATTRSTSG